MSLSHFSSSGGAGEIEKLYILVRVFNAVNDNIPSQPRNHDPKVERHRLTLTYLQVFVNSAVDKS